MKALENEAACFPNIDPVEGDMNFRPLDAPGYAVAEAIAKCLPNDEFLKVEEHVGDMRGRLGLSDKEKTAIEYAFNMICYARNREWHLANVGEYPPLATRRAKLDEEEQMVKDADARLLQREQESA